MNIYMNSSFSSVTFFFYFPLYFLLTSFIEDLFSLTIKRAIAKWHKGGKLYLEKRGFAVTVISVISFVHHENPTKKYSIIFLFFYNKYLRQTHAQIFYHLSNIRTEMKMQKCFKKNELNVLAESAVNALHWSFRYAQKKL